MHVTILALGSRGDVLPYAALGGGLTKAGHQVRFVTFESFAGLINEYGLEFLPIHGDAQSLVARAGADMLALMRSFGSLAEGYARDLSTPRLGETDLLINQLPAGLFGSDLAEKYGIQQVLASVIPLAKTRAYPLFGFPRVPLPGYNRWTYWLGEQLAWQMFRRVINRWRGRTLGLNPLPLTGYASQNGNQPPTVLNGFSRYVVDRPADWGDHIHITGYWFPQDISWQPSTELQAFLQAGSPPIFIGFGSMPVKDRAGTIATIIQALTNLQQRGILHAGWAGLDQPDLPDNVFAIEYAPYDWLFPQMAVVIHHGGSGTTGFGLRSGRPSCAIPFVFDQFYWGQRIAALGAGPEPIPFRKLTVERLAEVIHRSLSESQMQREAAELGEKIRTESGIQQAIQVIESL